MLVVDLSFASSEENLACDDRLLEGGRETLRFWETSSCFVVLGRSSRPECDVSLERCRAAGIPILRRSSGGGTVLLGPGCVNYSLILSVKHRPELANVAESYRILLGSIAQSLGVSGLQVCESDLLLDGRKVSGNAQRRTRDWLLHHGTVLVGMDLGLVETYLLEPQRRPAHRGGRTHREFLANLPIPPAAVKDGIARAFSA